MVLEIESVIYGFFIAFLSFSYIERGKNGIDVGKTFIVNVAGTIGGGILLSIIFYLILPTFVGLWWGWFNVIAVPLLIGAVICALLSDSKGIILQVIKILAVLITFGVIALTPMQHANDFYDIPQVTDIKNISAANGVFDPINIRHVRLVDQDLAYSLAQNVIGGSTENLGSIYEVHKGEMHIQMVKGHEYWVAPLEFQDYWKWSNKLVSPGFVMVDAEDPFAVAQMYLGYNMRYMPSAYFSEYLARHVYANGYMNVKLEDFTFEVTDELAPRWTVTTTKPTINNDGDVVRAVLEINPESGTIKEHPVGNVPAWIDRVTPERIALQYATWIGALSHGWWNAYGPWNAIHQDVNEVTTVKTKDEDTQEMFFVYGSDNMPYWFGGMTSQSYSDQSLTGIVLVDARNPTRMIRIKMTGANEQAALDAVNSQFTNFPDRYGTALIPYNIYGVLTYIIPVDSHTSSGNIFQGVGFVDAISKHAIVGATKELALEDYKDYLATKNIATALTSESDKKSLAGTVVRIGEVTITGKSNYRLFLDSSDAIFSVNPNAFPAVTITNTNDRVNITYVDTGDTVLEASAFTNSNVRVRIGKEQVQLNKEAAVLQNQKDANWNVQQDYTKKLEQLRGE